MTNFFRKRKLRAFSVAVFLFLIIFVGIGNSPISILSVKTAKADVSAGDLNKANTEATKRNYTGDARTAFIIAFSQQKEAQQDDSAAILAGIDAGNALIDAQARAYGRSLNITEQDINAAIGNANNNFRTGNDRFIGLKAYIDSKKAGGSNLDAISSATNGATRSQVSNILDDGQCAIEHPINCIMQMLYGLLYGIAWVVSWITYVFDIVFRLTVVEMSQRIKDITIINTGWTAVRDLANISFIFILLYLAIATILQLDEHGVKHSLSRLIIAAVLINFSLFFTKVIIDVPNILSIQIYSKITSNQPENAVGPGGLGSAFFKILKPEKVVPAGEIFGVDRAGTTPLDQDAARSFAKNGTFPTFIMMIILYFFILVVFLAAAIIFIKRFVMLLFYMIFSPLAFAGMAIPIHSLQSAAKDQFWSGLIKESFYAPIFLMCAYLALVTGTSLSSVAIDTTSETFSGTVFGFVVVIVMLVASLIIAESMGVKGAGGAMGFYKSMSGAGLNAVKWVGSNTITRGATAVLRGTVGKLSYNALEGKSHGTHAFVQWLTQARSGNLGATRKLVANAATSVLHAGANIKAGETGESFMEAKESKKAGMKAYEYEVKDDPARIAEYYHEMSRRGENDLNTRVAVEQEWEDKDPKHQAEILARLRHEQTTASTNAARARQIGTPAALAQAQALTTRANALQASIDHLYTRRLSASEKDEVDRATEKPLEFHREVFHEIAEAPENAATPWHAVEEAHARVVQAQRDAVRDHGAGSAEDLAAQANVTATNTIITNINTARAAHATAVEAHETAVRDHGAASNEAVLAQQNVVAARTNIRNVATPIITPQLQEFYNTLNVNQKVGLRPEQYSLPFLHRTGKELEQIQRKSNTNSQQDTDIETSIKSDLEGFLTEIRGVGWGRLDPQKQAQMKELVNYMIRNGKTWFSGTDNMQIVEQIKDDVIMSGGDSNTFAK